MATSFEKVMNACLEAKATSDKEKKLVESKKPVKKTSKKAPAKKVAESKKALKSRRVLEAEEEEIVDDVILDDEEIVDDEVMDDVLDDVVVVVDPEIDAEEIDSVASELQDIVDDTPDGEVPTTDDYAGNYTYGCPICGTTFFSETEMGDGDECPVCGGTPNGYVLAGQVVLDAGEEEVIDDEEIVDDGEGYEEVDELEIEEPVDEEEYSDEEEERLESLRRQRAMKARKEAMKKRNVKRSATPKQSAYQLDESTFNPFMTKFIRENYKNAKSFTIKAAKLNRKTNTLTLECVVTRNNGSTKTCKLNVRNFNVNSKVMNASDASNTFKCESKVAPFKFSVRRVGNTIKCEGLKYNFVTKSVKEGKKYQVTGNLIRESKQAPRTSANFTKGRRK